MIGEGDKRRFRAKLEAAMMSCTALRDEAWVLAQDSEISADEYSIISHACDGAEVASISLGFIAKTLKRLEG